VPHEIRKLVQKLFFAGGATSNQNRKQNADQRMDDQLQRIRQVGHAYGVAGFISPKLVLNKEDVRDDQNEVWVGLYDLGDLSEFVRICEGDEQLAARRLVGFSQ
jgi:hypothetical protein